MNTSLTISAFLLVSAGAAGVGALPNPYQGSDTVNDLTHAVIAAIGGITDTYIGGGSGNGQSAMVSGSQATAPMSRMTNSSGGVCTKSPTTTESIVIGLDAVDILASAETGGSATCNSQGLTFNNPTVLGSNNTWKQTLALVYGGEKNASGVVVCDGALRTALVANWSNLFQNTSCTNGASACGDNFHQTCSSPTFVRDGSGTITGITPGTCSLPASTVLWHAFRRDDASGTSDTLASILGLSPGTSGSSNNGFGASPYCNSMNWDVTAANASCAQDVHSQFVGPGGIFNPLNTSDATTFGHAVHKRPPPGAWGDAPDPTNKATDADVLPTGMQDNDPIRRPCVGSGAISSAKEQEEVCNLDIVKVGAATVGQLGLVLAIPDVIYIPRDLSRNAFPTTACSGSFVKTKAPAILNCAPAKATTHSGECPDGDALNGGLCVFPTDSTLATTTCQAQSGKHTAIVTRNYVSTSQEGRAFNLWYTDGGGSANDGNIRFTQQVYPTATGTVSRDSAQGITRIHTQATVPAGLGGCTSADATDNVGCLVHADQCSIGYSGNGALSWGSRAATPVASDNSALLVNTVAPSSATVQLLGKAGEYPLSRKLYFGTLAGFPAVTGDELSLAQHESTASFIDPILTNNGFFTLGGQSPAGADAPFCEDFNEQTVCAAGSNVNACAGNGSAGVPTAATICGDGVQGAYEECDNGAANGTSGNNCSVTCRCVATGSFTGVFGSDGVCH